MESREKSVTFRDLGLVEKEGQRDYQGWTYVMFYDSKEKRIV